MRQPAAHMADNEAALWIRSAGAARYRRAAAADPEAALAHGIAEVPPPVAAPITAPA